MKPNTEFVPFAKPSIGPEEEAAVLAVLRSGWLTTGKVAREFEEAFKAKTGSRHALAVNSATSGLHLALEAIGIKPGDRVAMSPYTFAASAETVRYLGADVTFVDTSEHDSNIDPEALERALEADASIKAVMPVHVGGLPCDMERILDSCGRHGCKVVEDSAHAFPVRTGRGFSGAVGDIGVYSFYVTKTITTGEGGMIVTDDDALAARMKVMRLHGIDRDIWNRYTDKGASWEYRVVEPGFKYNMPDILAAVGVEQLRKAERFLSEREAIAARYDKAFRDIGGLELPPRNPGAGPGSHAWHLYQVGVDENVLGMSRDSCIDRLRESNVGTSVHFIPLHTMPYWASRYGLSPESFPNALKRFRSAISLPIFHGMSDTQVDAVIQAVREMACGRITANGRER